MSLIHLAAILAAAFAAHAPPAAEMATVPTPAQAEVAQPAPQDARLYLASLHVGQRGPGHIARTHPAAAGGGGGACSTDGQIDLACATVINFTVIR